MGSPMKTVTILRSFDAYPKGEKEHFHEGQEIEVDEKTASDWKKKGLAKVKPAPSYHTLSDE